MSLKIVDIEKINITMKFLKKGNNLAEFAIFMFLTSTVLHIKLQKSMHVSGVKK